MFLRVDLGAWALLLIAMGIGYFVCLKASKEGTKLFKYGGYVIGVIILIGGLILAIGDMSVRMRRQRTVPKRPSTGRATTVPKTGPTIKRSEQPALPRRSVGVTEQRPTTQPKAPNR